MNKSRTCIQSEVLSVIKLEVEMGDIALPRDTLRGKQPNGVRTLEMTPNHV